MVRLSISRAWEQTKELLRRDGRLFIAVALAFLVLPQTILGAFAPATPEQATAAFFWILVITLLLALVGQVAINRLAIPPGATVALAIKRGIGRIFALIIALTIVFLAVGLLFFIASFILLAAGMVTVPVTGQPPPGGLVAVLLLSMLILYSIFQLAVPISAAEEGGPIQLLRRAWQLGRSSYWRLAAFLVLVITGVFFFWLTAQVIAGLAITAVLGPPEAGSIGVIVVSFIVALAQAAWTVVTAVMLACIYVQLASGSRDQLVEPSVPTSGS